MKYLYLSKEILKDKRLTPSTKRIAHHLFHISGFEEEKEMPSNNDLRDKFNMSKPTVINAVKMLKEYDYLKIDEENNLHFFINGTEITSKDFLGDKLLCNMLGDFVVVPTFALYCNELTPAEFDAYAKFFDFYYNIEKDGTFSLKKRVVHINSVSTYYGDDESSFAEHIKNIKEKGYIDYKVIKNGKSSKLIGCKVFKAEQKWVIYNGKTQKIDNATIKTKEEVIQPKKTLEAELTGKEEYIPTEEEIAERDTLLKQLPDFWKREYNASISNGEIRNQIIWLKRRIS